MESASRPNPAARLRPQKIAILGGGMASLAAAYRLSNQLGWQDRYEITVYQLGWRLGGKGASSRNRNASGRIEEHGLHVWFGCYANAFQLLRRCYEELGRPATHPFPTVDDAFQSQHKTPLMERTDGEWLVWPVTFPPIEGKPGAEVRPSAWDHLRQLIRFADQSFARWPSAIAVPQPPQPKRRLRRRLIDPPEAKGDATTPVSQLRRVVESPLADRGRGYRWYLFLWDAYQTWRRRQAAIWRLAELKKWSQTAFEGLAATPNTELRRILIGIDLAVTAARGVLADWVLYWGLEHLDGEDLRKWLRRHGAHPETVWSAPIRALYDLCFAYEDGETGNGQPTCPGRPNFAAGTALETAFRIAFTYAGSVCYMMRAGMGDVVIAPIYLALKQRGVRFEFFHRVTGLEPTPDGKSIATIHVDRQARTTGGTYRPLIQINGLECWPSEPLYEQLEHGDDIRGVNLESRWNGWSGEAIELQAGRDFDKIVLGISLAALPEICAQLIARSRRWQRMVRYVKTVQTQTVQLWSTRDLAQLGWRNGPVPVNAAPEPVDVWCDRTDLLRHESWPSDTSPRSLQYLCGPMAGDYASRPPSDRDVPRAALDQVRRTVVTAVRDYAQAAWPGITNPGTAEGVDWDFLYDQAERNGESRLDAQYLRANVDPSERYVLSIAKSGRHRLKPNEAGYHNLYLAGDWTRTSYNAGCIEAATISGIEAANALLGIQPAGSNVFRQVLRWILAFAARWLLLPLFELLRGIR